MTFLDLVARHRVIAIVRGTDTDAASAATAALVAAGIELVEVSMTTPSATTVIEGARAAGHPVGAGTVRSADDAKRAVQAGASFVVTPGLCAGVDEAIAQGVPVLAGAMTPSEVLAAHARGASAVKLFPAAALGGPGYLRALRDPLPDIAFVPVGGVDVDAAREYLTVGAVAVGVGSPLVGDAASGGSLDALRSRAARFAELVADD